MAQLDPFQQQQGKASIFDETREQNRVTKCISQKQGSRNEEEGKTITRADSDCILLDFKMDFP